MSAVVTSLSLASEGRSGTPFNPRNGSNTIDSGTTLTGMGGILVKPAHGVAIGTSYYAGATFNLETALFGSFLYGDSCCVLPSAARKMGRRTRGRIAYVVTVAGPEPADERTHPLDHGHYVEKQIRPVAEPVLAHLGLDFGKIVGTEKQLSLF
jgi:hypothetical protein